jgi:hypothetical protein
VAAVIPPVKPEPAVAIASEPVEPEAAVEPEPAAVIVSEPEAAATPEPAEIPAQPARAFNFTRPIPDSFPPDGYVLTTGQLTDVSSVNFVWAGTAPEYRFTLYRVNGDIVVPPSVVNSPSFTMQNPRVLKPGDYVWEVIQRDRQGRPGESLAARFTVTEGPVILKTLPTNNPGVLYGNR